MTNVYDVFKQLEREQQTQTFAEGEEIIDSNEYCMLESDTTRKILIPEKYSIFGVESDEKVKTVKFAFPRYVDDGRLDLMDYQIRINYKTANPDEENNKDQTQAQNVHTVGDYIVFEWLLSRRVTQYKGTITFIVCAITANDDGTITTEWNTTIATSQSIEGMEVSPNENEEQQARDLLTELLVSLNNSKNDAITEITQTKTQAISDVQAEGQTQTEAVDAKGAQVLESIPDDYTTLEGRVDVLEEEVPKKANVIVDTITGDGYVDAKGTMDGTLTGLKLYGKSVQKPTNGYNLFDLKHFIDLINEHTEESGCSAEILDYATGTFKITHPVYEEKGSDINLGFTVGEMFYNLEPEKLYNCTMSSASNTYGLGLYSKEGQGNYSGLFVSSVCISEDMLNGDCVLRNTYDVDVGINETLMFGYYYCKTENATYFKNNYEVFTNGIAQEYPTPDYPLPIESVGTYNPETGKYDITLQVSGVNAFDWDKFKGEGLEKERDNDNVTFNIDGNSVKITRGSSGIGDVLKNMTYKPNIIGNVTFQLEVENARNCAYFGSLKNGDYVNDYRVVFGKKDYNGISKAVCNYNNPDTYSIYLVNDNQINFEVTGKNFMIIPYDASEQEIKYVPFQGLKQITISLDEPLRGIPVNEGGNYTDTDGQQWVCDILDVDKGIIERNVKLIDFIGEGTQWFTNILVLNGGQSQTQNNYYIAQFVTRNSSSFLKKFDNYGSDNETYFLSEMFSVCLSTGSVPISLNTMTMGFNIGIGCDEIFCGIYSEGGVTVSTTKSGDLLVIPKDEYKEEPKQIESTVLQQLKQLETYAGETIILTDTEQEPGIEFNYNVDLKTYIDNAIAEAIAAIPTE